MPHARMPARRTPAIHLRHMQRPWRTLGHCRILSAATTHAPQRGDADSQSAWLAAACSLVGPAALRRHPCRRTPVRLLRPDIPVRFTQRRYAGAWSGGKGQLDCDTVLAGATGGTRIVRAAGVLLQTLWPSLRATPPGTSSPTEYPRPSPGEARRPRTSGRHPRSPPESGRVSIPEPARTADGSLPHGLGSWVDLR